MVRMWGCMMEFYFKALHLQFYMEAIGRSGCIGRTLLCNNKQYYPHLGYILMETNPSIKDLAI
jgi:hypothetical protein